MKKSSFHSLQQFSNFFQLEKNEKGRSDSSLEKALILLPVASTNELQPW